MTHMFLAAIRLHRVPVLHYPCIYTGKVSPVPEQCVDRRLIDPIRGEKMLSLLRLIAGVHRKQTCATWLQKVGRNDNEAIEDSVCRPCKWLTSGARCDPGERNSSSDRMRRKKFCHNSVLWSWKDVPRKNYLIEFCAYSLWNSLPYAQA